MAAISTIALATIAVAGLGTSIYQGQQQAQAQKKAQRMQEQSQREATASALAAERTGQMEEARVNKKQADMSSLMASEQKRAISGPTATMLTGQNQMRTTSLLGE